MRPEIDRLQVMPVQSVASGIALGYEDLNDHDELRHDPLMVVLGGVAPARTALCAGGWELDAVPAGAELPEADALSQVRTSIQWPSRGCPSTYSWRRTIATPNEDHPRSDWRRGRSGERRTGGRGSSMCITIATCSSAAMRALGPAICSAAKLRRANIDAAGSVEEVARIVAQIRRRWPCVRIFCYAPTSASRAGPVWPGARRWCGLLFGWRIPIG